MQTSANDPLTLERDAASPATGGFAIVPHATDPLARPVRCIWVGTGGNLAIQTLNDEEVVYKNVPSGSYIYAWAKAVRSPTTTASDLVGGY